MTDDRARRIRDLRNRRSTDDDGDEAASDADHDTDPEAASDADTADAENGSATADRATATDGNGETDDSESATDDETAVTDDETATGGDDSAADDADTSAGAEADAPSSAADAATGADATDEAGGDELTYDESAVTAAQSDVSPAEQSDVSPVDETALEGAEPTSDPPDDVGASPMVDTQELATESPFGGAIADASVMAEFVDDVGTESTADAGAAMGDTDGYGAGTSGQGGDVFDGSDDLVASTHADETIQMLEFQLNDNRYAVEIEQISAIVEMKEITRFPRGPEAIDGVTDLRGEITAVLDPTAMLDIERNELTDDQYIVVLERDDDKQKLGVRVTDVSQAVTYRTSQIDEAASVMDSSEEYEFINGIVKKSDDDRTELVTWLDTGQLIENTG